MSSTISARRRAGQPSFLRRPGRDRDARGRGGRLTLAGIGSRFIAGVIDFTIQLIVIIALWLIVRPAGGAGAAILSTASFALIFFYDVLFEVFGRGQTLGKRWTGLRVVRAGGRPITLARSSVRNILRLIDILPGFYAIGMTSIFITSRNQRLGDLAAGAHVVRIRHGDQRRSRQSGLSEIDPGPAATWDVSAVSQDDMAAVRAFLERRLELRAENRVEIASELASRRAPASAACRRTSATRSSSSCSWRRRRRVPSR